MKKMNNKGFSLVELIIVIAIMAILIGVLAPQYIKYVEKSRVSADEDCADQLKNAAMTATTDEEYIYSMNAGDKIELTETNVTVTPDSGTAIGLKNALGEYFAKWEDSKLKSKSYKGHTWIVSIYSDAGKSELKVKATWDSF
jgi:type IV pilus assembly protein PilA